MKNYSSPEITVVQFSVTECIGVSGFGEDWIDDPY